MSRLFWQCSVVLMLSSCGGGGGDGATIATPTPQCKLSEIASNGVCVTAAKVCTANAEKVWVRGHLDDVYLWYNEIKDVPKDDYSSPESYFDALLVKSKDRFSFTANQADIEAFQDSGLSISYGITWVNDPGPNNVGRIRIAYVEKGSPADLLGLERGYILMKIDGRELYTFTQAEFEAALFPLQEGVRHDFEISSYINPRIITARLTSKKIVQNPVPIARTFTVDTKKIGYVLFNDHNDPASDKLVAAMKDFKNQQIDELFVDLRYNSGGFLYVAAQLAAMVAGQSVQNQVFASFIYNDKHRGQNTNYFFEQLDNQNMMLPQLNLKRVFVFTGDQTCSASEAFINALSPFIDVVLIGSAPTCGKPYGFKQASNCDRTYFAIRYQGVNTVGQSVPTAGYAPRCRVEDNLGFALGETNEVMFNTANYYMHSATCPPWAFTQTLKNKALYPTTKRLYQAPWRSNLLIKNN